MKKRITRLVTALTLGTIAATGLALVDDLVATPQDSGWGAPDTTGTIVSGTVDTSTVIDTTLGDSGWG